MHISPRKLLTLLLLAAAVLAAALRTLPPAARPADAPAQQFSAGRAFKTIQAITGSPRLVGSPAFESARAIVLAQMAALGLETDVQNTTLDGVAVENTLGRWPGAASTQAILLSAHLDSVANSPGATDDGSGVAEVLETVRALQAGAPLRNSMIVLITAPEENCCYGARAFVSGHPWAKEVRLVINVDAGGVSGPSILADTGPQEGWLVEQMAQTLPDPIGSSAIEALGSPATDYTLMFRKAGLPGFDFTLSWSKRIHSPLDSLAVVNLASLQHQGEHLLAAARLFGNLSLDFPRMPRPIYFDLLGLTILVYPTAWAIPIFLIVSVVFAIALRLGFRYRRLRLGGLAATAGAFLASLLAAPVLLGLIQMAILATGPSASLAAKLTGDSPLSNTIRWGSLLLAVAAAVLGAALVRRTRQVRPLEFIAGTYFMLYLGAGATALALPALSYLFAWPLLAGSLSLVFRLLSERCTDQQPAWPVFLGELAAGLLAVIVMVPGLLIGLLGVDITGIILVPLLVTCWLGFMVAPLEPFFSTGDKPR